MIQKHMIHNAILCELGFQNQYKVWRFSMESKRQFHWSVVLLFAVSLLTGCGLSPLSGPAVTLTPTPSPTPTPIALIHMDLSEIALQLSDLTSGFQMTEHSPSSDEQNVINYYSVSYGWSTTGIGNVIRVFENETFASEYFQSDTEDSNPDTQFETPVLGDESVGSQLELMGIKTVIIAWRHKEAYVFLRYASQESTMQYAVEAAIRLAQKIDARLSGDSLPVKISEAPTVTATALPSTAGLEILTGPDYLIYDGQVHTIVGEITNSTDHWFDSFRVHATYYDSRGNVLFEDTPLVKIVPIPPNDKAPFILSSDVGGAASSVVSYQLQGLEGEKSDAPPYEDLQTTKESESEAYGYHDIAGEVINTGASDCEFTKIMGAYYTAQDILVDVAYTYAEADILHAQESSLFLLTTTSPYDHYRLWVTCDPTHPDTSIPVTAATAMPSTSEYSLLCDINTQSYGFEITGETGAVQTTYNNEAKSFNYDSSGMMTGITISVNRDLLFTASQHDYHIEGTITVNQTTNEVTYDVTATGAAFGDSTQTCKKP